MNNLRVFSNEEFGDVNIIVKNNKEYIEAIAIANILGYSNPRDAIIRHCREEGIIFSDVGVVTGVRSDGSEAVQYINKKFIDEGNVYRLIIRSKLPSARKFESWLMDEVIPSIRQNGAYMNDDVIEQALNNPDLIIQMASKLKQEKEAKMAQMKRANRLEERMSIERPYVTFGKQIERSEGEITVGQFAKLLNNNNISIGRNRLFDWFRNHGYLINTGKEKNMPKQVYIQQGLFKVCEKVVNLNDREVISTLTLITGKGQLYFTKRIIDMVNNDLIEMY